MSDPSTVTERAGFLVSGHVQGVGFRWAASRQAESLGLRGSVRNRADGTVEVSAEGTPDALKRFAEWLGHGPRGARVERVDRGRAELPVPDRGFEIIR